MAELITTRLRLRQWRDADLEGFAALNADPEVMRYFRQSGKLRQALTAAAFLKEAASHGNLRVGTVQHVRVFVQRLERLPSPLRSAARLVPPQTSFNRVPL